MHNNDFKILLRSVNYSSKLQIAKIHKNAYKIKCYLYKASWELEFSYKLYLAPNLQICLGTPPLPPPDFAFPNEQISKLVHIVTTYVECM